MPQTTATASSISPRGESHGRRPDRPIGARFSNTLRLCRERPCTAGSAHKSCFGKSSARASMSLFPAWSSTSCCRASTRPRRCRGCSTGCQPATGRSSSTTVRSMARPGSPARRVPWSWRAATGYGAACHAGLLVATSDVVAVMDADASLDPARAARGRRPCRRRRRRPGPRPAHDPLASYLAAPGATWRTWRSRDRSAAHRARASRPRSGPCLPARGSCSASA